MEDFAISISVSAVEEVATSVHELTVEQVATSEDTEVEHVSRVSLEYFTQAQAEGYASSMLSDTVELDVFVVAYQDCPDWFNDIFIMVHLIRNVVSINTRVRVTPKSFVGDAEIQHQRYRTPHIHEVDS